MSDGNPANFWNAAAVIKGIFETKLCLAAHQSFDTCAGQIIAAHTLPRSQLRRIASDGHVYVMATTAGERARNAGELTTKRIGINNFSVLHSFCAKHDNDIFAHLEKDALVFDSHQLTLLTYRTLASELYRKVMASDALLHLIKSRKKPKTSKEQRGLLRDAAFGQRLGISDVGKEFDRCAKNLASHNYDDVSALIVHFRNPPSLMTAGSFLPEYDYNGEILQRIYDSKTIGKMVSFNILASEDRAVLAMLWFREDTLIKTFADSFIAQSQINYTTLAIQTAFEYLENTCMQPEWWEKLRKAEQSSLLRRMETGSTAEEHTANCLTFGGVCFDQWDYCRHEFVNV
jgi:hypothetical protein